MSGTAAGVPRGARPNPQSAPRDDGCPAERAGRGAIRSLVGLQKLDLGSGLTSLPESMGGLVGLQTLNLHYCSGLTSLPDFSHLADLHVYK